MKNIIIEEVKQKYKVVLYSDNDLLIKVLYKTLFSNGLHLEVKGIRSVYRKNKFDYEKRITTIVDLSKENVDINRVFNEKDNVIKNITYIVRKSRKNIKNKYLSKNTNTSVIVVSKITKKVATNIADELIKSFNKGKKLYLDYSDNSIRKKKVSTRVYILSFSFFLLTIPYVLYLYLIICSTLMKGGLLKKINIYSARDILSYDVKIKNAIFNITGLYCKIPILNKIYSFVSVYSDQQIKTSKYIYALYDNVEKIDTLLINVFYPNNPNNKAGNNKHEGDMRLNKIYILPEINKEIDNDYLLNTNDNIKGLFGLYEEISGMLGNTDENYFLIVFQNGRYLTPTGGKTSNTFLVYLKNGRVNLKSSTLPEELEKLFAGRISGIQYLNETFQGTDFDKTLNIEDKFDVLNVVSQKVYDQKLNGILGVGDESLVKLRNIKNFLNNGSPSFEGSLKVFEILNGLFSSKDLMLYLQGGQWEKSVNQKDTCQRKIGIMKAGENDRLKTSEIGILGNIKNDTLTISINIKSGETDHESTYILKTDTSESIDLGRNVSGEKYINNNDEYLVLKSYFSENYKEIAKIHFNVGDCLGAFSIDFEKQPGNNNSKLLYEFTTDKNYSFYLNNVLIYEGNKFYNTKSLDFDSDKLLYIVK